MKSNENLRKKTDTHGPEDTLRKATKLPPLKKSGKEKKSFYRELDDDDDDLDLKSFHKRESVLDYYDDGEEEEWDGEEEGDSGDFDEDWEDEWDGDDDDDDEDEDEDEDWKE